MGEEFRNQSSAGTSHRYAAIRRIASGDDSYGNPAATQIAMSNQNLGKICEVQNLVAPQLLMNLVKPV